MSEKEVQKIEIQEKDLEELFWGLIRIDASIDTLFGKLGSPKEALVIAGLSGDKLLLKQGVNKFVASNNLQELFKQILKKYNLKVEEFQEMVKEKRTEEVDSSFDRKGY